MVPNLVQVAQEGLNLFSQSCSQSVHLTSSKKETKQPSSKLSGLHANWLEKGRPFLLITHLGQRLCVLHNDLEQTYLPEVLGVEGHRGGWGNLHYCCAPEKIQYKHDSPRLKVDSMEIKSEAWKESYSRAQPCSGQECSGLANGENRQMLLCKQIFLLNLDTVFSLRHSSEVSAASDESRETSHTESWRTHARVSSRSSFL